MESNAETENFVTVVSVGSEPPVKTDQPPTDLNGSGYVTVLTIGDNDSKDVTEEVLVYRLPGERLGFGLKFEGGTKASEFVKRLFIQSCAADSPASRVKSSWGKLSEGDEVLKIDGIPVNSMTRIDCVRCLKDSNVVIKLLVRHFAEVKNVQKARSVEDIPLVISAEKKRIPPPPPPVPPRKIPRKFMKSHQENKENQEINNNPVPTSRHINEASKAKKFQSPRSSGRASYSPDIPRRDRRFSDGSLGPPDAEVYINLISQESTQSLSESDDTGSTISTVIDRLSSFPTTTTSSFAGSLPSTPTSVQKQLDLTNLLNFEDEEITSQKPVTITPLTKDEPDKGQNDEDGVPLQPPSYFQDAPLSYGNEDMRVIETNEMDQVKKNEDNNVTRKPPVPPRSRDLVNGIDREKSIHDENMNIPSLPRLVDFLPKASTKENIEVMKLFLDNERRDFNDEYYFDMDMYNADDIYSSKWSISPQLTTIGEVEEEQQEPSFDRSNTKSTPIVIVENADTTRKSEISNIMEQEKIKDIDGNMDTPPSDSRQPPDGHEFPDYVESNKISSAMSYDSVEPDPKIYKSVECINLTQNVSSLNDHSITNNVTLKKTTSVSNHDLSNVGRPPMYEISDDIKFNNIPEPTKLHTRSQSLIDMSALSKQKNDKWNMMMEQRRKGLSKLKGLVIPENVNETETTPAINIPEIKSIPNALPVTKLEEEFNSPKENSNSYNEYTRLSLNSPPWSNQTNTLPKYSPAFKRKTLHVYTTTVQKEKTKPTKLEVDENMSDPPKSLESITSPTRSDYSFDYVSCSKKTAKNDPKKESHILNRLYKDVGKSEDESDNDSAVSSSQSSYISRCSPPASPTINDYENLHGKSDDYNSQCRLLKPSSVEAINRKNILASAKCRSGRDLKVGSPVIQRKNNEKEEAKDDIKEKVNTAFSQVDDIAKEIETTSVIVPNGTSTPIKPPSSSISNVSATTVIKEKVTPNISSSPSGLSKPTSPSAKIEVPTPKKEPLKEPLKFDYKNSSYFRKQPAVSVNDLKKNFEKFGTSPALLPNKIVMPKTIVTKPVKSVMETKNHLQKTIDTTAKKNPEVKTEVRRASVVKRVVPTETLHQKTVVVKVEKGGILGVSLAGGDDCENKDITIQRIRYGSRAYEDGTLKRGDRIVSVNNVPFKGLTHEKAVNLLKGDDMEYSFVIEESEIAIVPTTSRRLSAALSTQDLKSTGLEKVAVKSPTNVITLNKDGAGLGFSIEGGKDSPQGDVPLLIKKIFQGSAAEKSGELKVGDEILAVNDISFANLTRIEAWNQMKKLPDGKVSIHLFR